MPFLYHFALIYKLIFHNTLITLKLHRDFAAVLENKYDYEMAEELWENLLPKIHRQSNLESRGSLAMKSVLERQTVELDRIFGEGEV